MRKALVKPWVYMQISDFLGCIAENLCFFLPYHCRVKLAKSYLLGIIMYLCQTATSSPVKFLHPVQHLVDREVRSLSPLLRNLGPWPDPKSGLGLEVGIKWERMLIPSHKWNLHNLRSPKGQL